MLKNLVLDPACPGKTMYLAGVAPSYKYDENKNRTSEIEGYRYDVVLVDKGFEKIGVKIASSQQVEAKEGEVTQVAFDGLEVKVYVIGGELKLAASAQKIAKAKN